jgi:hypothetical protein
MFGSLQTISWRLARRFRSIAIIAAIAGSILVADYTHCGTPPTLGEAAPARTAEPGPCPPDARYVAEVLPGLPWRLVPCSWEASAVCDACATCASDAWCAPVKTRGIGPRSPGGGPDD